MDDTRKQVLDLILKSEGGLNEDEPEHVGGVSYAGITQQAYTGWVNQKHVCHTRNLLGI